MHIHPGITPRMPSLGAAESTLAARLAEQTRKKLLASASALDAASSQESAWMVGAWSGQGGRQGNGSDAGSTGEEANRGSNVGFESGAKVSGPSESLDQDRLLDAQAVLESPAVSGLDSVDQRFGEEKSSTRNVVPGPVSYWV